ncbi:MAG: BMC domain-containing protein, partial [Gaiellales bacterium]
CGLSEIPEVARKTVGFPGAHSPALVLIELESIAKGIVVADAMIKAAPLASIRAGTVQPGRYLVLGSGDTASVEVSLEAGRDVAARALIDVVFLPGVHPSVTSAIEPPGLASSLEGVALGVIETASVAAVLEAADAGVKAAEVTLAAIRLADGLGGKGYALFSGDTADVEAAIEAARPSAESRGHLIAAETVPRLAAEIGGNIVLDLRFGAGARVDD